mmetsp:Transcript_14457/g.27933  ORF Transcript_14457/g.27933 Transcript_14457/m.27933 type:complete len:340 (-) Transcript_14457:271-1290(-)
MAQLEFLHSGKKRAREFVVHLVVHENLVRTDAGLASISQSRTKQSFGCLLKVGVLENDEGSVAAKLQAHPLDRVRRLGHQKLSHGGGSCESNFSDILAAHEFLPDGGRVPAHELNASFRESGLLCEKGQGNRAQRGVLGGLEHHSATRSQGRPDLPRDHREGEVPRRYGAHHPHRLLDHHDPLSLLRPRQNIPVDASGLLREPGDGVRASRDLDVRLPHGLAVLERDERSEVAHVFSDQLLPPDQRIIAPLSRDPRLVPLLGEGDVGSLYRDARGGGAKLVQARKLLSPRRVQHRELPVMTDALFKLRVVKVRQRLWGQLRIAEVKGGRRRRRRRKEMF